MATNIVSTISRLLTPEVVGKLATASGLDGALAQRTVAAAVPSILSGLTGIATRPGGARQLANAVAEQPTDIFASIATRPAQTAEKGTNLLSSLLGGGALGILTATVSKFLGIGEGSTRTLMGLLTPLIMGVLGREQHASGLDAGGLARMLTGQKEEIADAMPSGLSGLLEASGLYKSVDSSSERRTFESPRAAAYDAPRAASMQRVVGDRASTRGVSWPYWVLPLLLLGGLLWYMLPSGPSPVEPVRTSQVPNSIFLESALDNWVSMGASTNDYVNQDVYNRAGEKLGTIKDVLIGPDGKMAAALVNVGRFLGIGDKDIAVPFSALQLEQRDNNRRIVIDATKEALQVAPTFERRLAPKQ
jgi:hypothetical protein